MSARRKRKAAAKRATKRAARKASPRRRAKKRARPTRKRRPRRHLKMASPILERRSEPTLALPQENDPPRGLVSEWTRLASEPLGDFRIFKMRRDVSIHPRTNAEHRFVVLEGGDWVNVIPVTDEGNVVFVEQFRHGVRSNTLEVPGGMVDAGESPANAAARELLEETGYSGGAPVELGWIHPNPAIQDNRCWSYVVRGVRRTAPAHTEGSEDIAVLEIPLRDVPRLIAAGRITHALVVVAFQWLWLREGR